MALFLFLLLSVGGRAQVREGKTIVKPRLVAGTKAVQPGKPFTVGVYFQIEKGWHLYWENAGDGGLPIRVNWKLPNGFKVSPLRWPAPIRFDEAGGLTTYGYTNETMLLARVTPPSSVKGGTVSLAADVSWLVCEALCLPGDAKVDLKLPVGPLAPSPDTALIVRFEQQLPRPLAAGPLRLKSATATKQAGQNWLIRIDLIGRDETPREFFPHALDNFTVDYHEVKIQDSAILIPVAASEAGLTPNSMSGVLRTDRSAYELRTKLELL
jgi:thiol:disulfide interchange protein DsbD